MSKTELILASNQQKPCLTEGTLLFLHSLSKNQDQILRKAIRDVIFNNNGGTLFGIKIIWLE